MHPAVNAIAAAIHCHDTLDALRVLQCLAVSCGTKQDTTGQRHSQVLKQLTVVVKVCQDIGRCDGCRPDRGPHSGCLCIQLRECVAVQFWDSLLLLKPRLDVSNRNNLIGFIHIHGVNKKLNISVMIKNFCLKIIRIVSAIVSQGVAVMVLITTHGQTRKLDILSSNDLDILVCVVQWIRNQIMSIHIKDPGVKLCYII